MVIDYFTMNAASYMTFHCLQIYISYQLFFYLLESYVKIFREV